MHSNEKLKRTKAISIKCKFSDFVKIWMNVYYALAGYGTMLSIYPAKA